MEIYSSSNVHAKKGDTLRLRASRDCQRLILVLAGSAFCSAGMEECMLSKGAILLLPPELELCILPMEDYEHIEMEAFEQFLPGKDQFYCLFDDPTTTGANILWIIFQQLRVRPTNWQNTIAALAEALRQFLLSLVDQGPNTDVLALEKLLRDNISNVDFHVTEAMERIPQTTGYTRRLFHQAFGCSPRAYLTNLRIGAAKLILMTENLPVSEIAYRCGFADAKSFTRRFHQATGYTPTEFKNLPKRRSN